MALGYKSVSSISFDGVKKITSALFNHPAHQTLLKALPILQGFASERKEFLSTEWDGGKIRKPKPENRNPAKRDEGRNPKRRVAGAAGTPINREQAAALH